MNTTELVKILGEEFLLWAANLNELSHDQPVPPSLQPLIPIAHEFQQILTPNFLPRADREFSSRINQIRLQCDGEIPEMGSQTIEDYLKDVATAFFPEALLSNVLLANSTSHHIGMQWHPMLSRDQREICEQLFRSDIVFGPAIKQGSSEDETFFVASETGSGGIQLAVLPSDILGHAARIALLAGGLTLRRFHAAIDQVIAWWKAVLTNQGELEVSAFVGLHGLALPEDCTVELSCGKLRPFRSSDLATLPHDARPTMMHSEPEPPFQASIVLETKVSLKVAFGPTRLQPLEPASANQQISETTRRVILAVALATREKPTSLTRAWSAMTDPTRQHLWMAFTPNSRTPHPPRLLTFEEAKAIQKWDVHIATNDSSKLQIAMDRIRRAIGERLDPQDGLIDAVIALESLLGGRREGITNRISTAASILLAPPAGRAAFKRQVANLYDLRCKLVHGTGSLSFAEATDARNRVVGIFLDCLREI